MRRLLPILLSLALLAPTLLPQGVSAQKEEETQAPKEETEIEERCRKSAGIEDLMKARGALLFHYRRCITNAKQKEKGEIKGERKHMQRERLQKRGVESFEESVRERGDTVRRSREALKVRPLKDRREAKRKLLEGRAQRRVELQEAEAEDLRLFEEENLKEIKREGKTCADYPKREQRRCEQRKRMAREEREKEKEESRELAPAFRLRASRRACTGLRGQEKLECLRNALRAE